MLGERKSYMLLSKRVCLVFLICEYNIINTQPSETCDVPRAPFARNDRPRFCMTFVILYQMRSAGGRLRQSYITIPLPSLARPFARCQPTPCLSHQIHLA